MKRNWIKGIEHFSPFSSLSKVNVSKLKEAEYCIEALRIVRPRRLIVEQRIRFAHPFFPEISSSFKAAVLLWRDFLLYESEASAPKLLVLFTSSPTRGAVWIMHRVLS